MALLHKILIEEKLIDKVTGLTIRRIFRGGREH